jgi:hypothetical protein
MAQTVVKDQAVKVTQLCSGGVLQQACSAAGIS